MNDGANATSGEEMALSSEELSGLSGSSQGLRNRKLPSQKTKSKKWKWNYRMPPELTEAQETTFLNMQLRKSRRALTGTKHRNTNYEFIALAVFLVIIYSVGTQAAHESSDSATASPYFVTLTLGQVVVIGIWLFVAVAVTTMFRESRFIELLYWMLVYLPLMSFVLVLFFDDERVKDGRLNVLNYGQVVGICLIIAEALAVIIFVCIYYVYPKLINSEGFRRSSRAAQFWRIKMLGDWTMTYRGPWGRVGLDRRYTCKYHGETNKDGLPHGLGQWFDDEYDGEVLTGNWRDGVPIAPYVSRHYGRGDVFSAVRIFYVMASDDDFTTSKFWPSNEKPPRCGIAQVECSVSGAFYNELPCSSELIGPVEYDENTSVKEMLKNLSHLGEGADLNVLHINANDPRGVQINGHVHAITGETFSRVDEIVIKLRPEKRMSVITQLQSRPGLHYMPISARSFHAEKLVARDEEEEEESEEVTPPISQLPSVDESELFEDEEVKVPLGGLEEGSFPKLQQPNLVLKVQGWKPSPVRDCLVYVGGFNCPLNQALENLGQFIAMTKLDAHVYPILFEWPVGTVLSYHAASRASHRDQNRQNFCKLMRGLQNAGVRNVHFMSHSMGAQTLIGSFCDKPDGSRSDVSMCFRLAPDCDESEPRDNENEDNLLVCKTMTILNPDFPVSPFVNHAFRSIRRICQTITIVGDRSDGALFYSELVNGIAVRYFGYEQPDPLLPNDHLKEKFDYCHTIGRTVEALHFPADSPLADPNANKASLTSRTKDSTRSYLHFSERAPLTLVREEAELEKAWLDLDVVDTTGLDTNIADIRHNAFALNPILLNDLEELIRTGNRAMKRSSLLYRDGNLFSFCHAPSFVSA